MTTLRHSKQPLRVGLLIDSYTQPLWVRRVIEQINSSSIAKITLVVKNEAVKEGGRPPIVNKLANAWRNRPRLLYALYTKADQKWVKVRPDAFEPVSTTELLSNVPVIRVQPVMTKHTDSFPDEVVEELIRYELDVALRFGFRILKGKALKIAKWGVWSYHHGDSLLNRGGPPGFWEVMCGEPVTGSVLQVLTEDLDNGKILCRSWAPTLSTISIKRNKNNYYWKSSAFVMRKLTELYEQGTVTHEDASTSPYRPYYRRLYKVPGNTAMAMLLLKVLRRFLANKILWLLYDHVWSIAYSVLPLGRSPNDVFYRLKYITSPKDRYWADPFPVKHNGEFFVFVEEYSYKTRKGIISVLKLDEKGVVESPIKVLEREYHLSYPFIFEWRGTYYMIPESAASRRIELYKCISFPLEWELEKILMEGVNAVDTTLTEANGFWWMFTNIAVEDVARNWDELHLFYADNPTGPWRGHRMNPVKSDVRSARPAGRLFKWNGGTYRPAQDCSKGYGHAVSINRINDLSPTTFSEEEVWKILPEWGNGVVGTHTLNSIDELTVVDCLVRKRRFFGGSH